LLIRSFKASSTRIAYPTFDGKRGHPPLIACDLISTILKNDNQKGGLRSLLSKIEHKKPKQIVEINVPDANILFDMDTPEDYISGLHRFTRLGYPTMQECAIILKLYPMPEKGLVHARLVANIAKVFCQAIIQNGKRILDPELCRVCGWLHDIAKGKPNHEQEGGRLLRNLGFGRAAEIVAAHKDLDWLPGELITEKEIVHLADKLAHGGKVVDIKVRFEEKLAIHKDNPEAVEAIRRRYEKARQLGEAIEAETSRQLHDIISDGIVA
jgi:HD superfamily phosphodiesterase